MERLEGSVLSVSAYAAESTAAFYSSGFALCLQRASSAFTSIKGSRGPGVSVIGLAVPLFSAHFYNRRIRSIEV